MTFGALLDAMTRSGIDSLAGFDRDAAIAAGIDPARVRGWATVHETYFGATRATRRQQEALSAARQSGMSLDQLSLIERCLKPIDVPAERHCLRMQLLATRGTYETLRRRARDLIPADETAPVDAMSFTRSRNAKRGLRLVADEHFLAELEHAVSEAIDPKKPAGPQMVANFVELVRGGGGVARTAPRPQLLVPLPEHVRIVRGEGDDVVLGLTDGTTMTGADYLNTFIATEENCLEAAVFHPTEGAVNLYRNARHANQKQRDLARAAMPVCAGPDCRRGADQCEIHHVAAWQYGGETNVDNLAAVCRYHNRVNDDDPRVPKRGRIEMLRGTPTWVSPRGHPLTTDNPHRRFGAMNALFGQGTGPP